MTNRRARSSRAQLQCELGSHDAGDVEVRATGSRPEWWRWAFGTAVCVVAAFQAHDAYASGFYVSQRGVRPLGRGGAFVAGADDLGAIFYNPAGIYDAGSQFLIDGSFVDFNVDYTRQALLQQVDPNTGKTIAAYPKTFPTVSGSPVWLPIPTIVGSFSPHPDWVVAFGAFAPYVGLADYPATLNGQAAPQRYSLLNLDGSILAVLGGWVAWAPLKNFRVGAGVEALVGSFQAETTMSACIPERFFCSPEDPSWDALAKIDAAPIITPSGNVGFQWEFVKNFRLGGSFQLPFWIRAPATVKTRLPSSPLFNGVSQSGDSATVVFNLPFVIRLGIEARALDDRFRIELAGHYEQWSMHDAINVEPSDISLDNVPGFPSKYYLPTVSLPKNFQNSGGVELGAELTIKASENVRVTPRAGFMFESSAVPASYLTIVTVDSNKVTPSIGASVEIGKVRLDAVYARVQGFDVTVATSEAKVPQTIPIAANPPLHPDNVNAGTYSWNANVFGLGLAYTFGHPKKPEPAKTEDKSKDKDLPTTEEVNKPAASSDDDKKSAVSPDATSSGATGSDAKSSDSSTKPGDPKKARRARRAARRRRTAPPGPKRSHAKRNERRERERDG